RPDGLLDERRERRGDRGLRARADDPPALASSLLPRAMRAGGPREGDRPADVAPGDRGQGEDPARAVRARRALRARPRDPPAAHDAPLTAPRHAALRRGLQRGLAEELGL